MVAKERAHIEGGWFEDQDIQGACLVLRRCSALVRSAKMLLRADNIPTWLGLISFFGCLLLAPACS